MSGWKWGVVLLALCAVALQVQPAVLEADGGPGSTFDGVFTLTNDDARPLSVTLRADDFSTYLEDAATLSATSFLLHPQDSVNVQVRGTVPSLGPETHALRYAVLDGERPLGGFVIEMPISGTPLLRPKLEVRTADVVEQEAIVAQVKLFNFGNVVAYYNLTLEVLERGSAVGELRYPRLVQVLPGEEAEISLLYSDRLDPGDYQLRVRGIVNAAEDVEAQTPLRVVLGEQRMRIAQGDDLVLTVKRYDNTPRITYVVRGGGKELVRDTVFAESDKVEIPTSALGPGEYTVQVRTSHGQGEDVTQIALEIGAASAPHRNLLLLVLLAGVAFLLTPAARLHLRITLLELRLARRERQLKRILDRAHTLVAT